MSTTKKYLTCEVMRGWPTEAPPPGTDAETIEMLLTSLLSLRAYIRFDPEQGMTPSQFERMVARADNRIAAAARQP